MPTGYRATKSHRTMATASMDGGDARASLPHAAAAQQLQQQSPAQGMQQPAPMPQRAPRARKRRAAMAAAEAVAAEAPAPKRSKPAARWVLHGGFIGLKSCEILDDICRNIRTVSHMQAHGLKPSKPIISPPPPPPATVLLGRPISLLCNPAAHLFKP